MAYCGPRGIPLHEFLSWPQFSQDAALQWSAHEAARCSDCGTHAEDWDPAQGGSREARHWHAQVCLGCQRKQAAAEQLFKDKDKTRGLSLVSRKGSRSDCPVCTVT